MHDLFIICHRHGISMGDQGISYRVAVLVIWFDRRLDTLRIGRLLLLRFSQPRRRLQRCSSEGNAVSTRTARPEFLGYCFIMEKHDLSSHLSLAACRQQLAHLRRAQPNLSAAASHTARTLLVPGCVWLPFLIRHIDPERLQLPFGDFNFRHQLLMRLRGVVEGHDAPSQPEQKPGAE